MKNSETVMKTDYQKVIEKLKEVGAKLVFFADDETHEYEASIEVEGYNVNGNALAVISFEDGKCGLYKFVGKSGDPIENDLAFIDKLAQTKQETAKIVD